jgi:DNA-binding transcriptional ArsR family regulator
MESALSLEALAEGLSGFSHPIRIRAIVLMEFERGPRELADILGEPLGVVSYHVRMLKQYGLVTLSRTEPARGALAHYYVRTPLADHLLDTLNGTLDVPKRKRGPQGEARRAVLNEWATRTRPVAVAA